MTARRILTLIVFLVLASVTAWGTITITPATLPNGAAGNQYSQQLVSSAGNSITTWSNPGGGLPTGLSLSSTGLISGTLTASGTFTFTIHAASVSTPVPDSGDQSYTVIVIAITTTSLPGGTVGQIYNQQLASNPSGAAWALAPESSLPPNLSVGATGIISGQLLQVLQATTFTFTVSATLGAGTAFKSLSITVSPAGALKLDTPALHAAVGVAFSTQLTGTGGVPPYTFVLASGIQNGFSISLDGVLSGTPLVAGATNLVVTIKDSPGNQAGGTIVVT